MVSSTRRTAGCGPACPVVWQGRVGDHSPYADSTLYWLSFRNNCVRQTFRFPYDIQLG